MPNSATKPVGDDVPKIDNEVAVGSDLEFQRKWWIFERVIWSFFTLLLILDLIGVFGKGPVANARREAPDGSIDVQYERVERYGTPSMLTVHFRPAAVQDGRAQLWVSESLVKELGNQRIVPQPEASVLGEGGIRYTFLATGVPATAEFALQPTAAGRSRLQLGVPGFNKLTLDIFTVP